MRKSAELRRFPSSHPSLFSGFFWIFWGQMRGENEGEALYRWPDPCRPQEGRPAPLAPVGWAAWLVAWVVGWLFLRHSVAFFSFLYLKKIKISKIYVCFEIFQKYPQSPPHRATGLKCNFFFSNSQWGPWKKKALSPPQRATGACRPPLGRQGPVARWGGDRLPFFFQGPILSYSSV